MEVGDDVLCKLEDTVRTLVVNSIVSFSLQGLEGVETVFYVLFLRLSLLHFVHFLMQLNELCQVKCTHEFSQKGSALCSLRVFKLLLLFSL